MRHDTVDDDAFRVEPEATQDEAAPRYPTRKDPDFPVIAKVIERLKCALPEGLDVEERNARKYSVVRTDEAAYGKRVRREVGSLLILSTGEVTLRRNVGGFELTEDEKADVKKEVLKADAEGRLLKNIITTEVNAQDHIDWLCEKYGSGPMFVFRGERENEVLLIQQRVYSKEILCWGADKHDTPWTFWSDGEWRNCEGVDELALLPLWGLDQLRNSRIPVMIHEGAKAAEYVHHMVTDDGEEAQQWRATHPWAEDLKRYAHLGWPGGATNAHRVDWSPIRKRAADVEVAVVCDNDQVGINAAKDISKLLKRQLTAVVFNENFPDKFDLADPWPEGPEWRTTAGRYCGPTLAALSQSATWATEEVKVEVKADNKKRAPGRPAHKIRDQFSREWVMVTTPDVLINRRRPENQLLPDAFNRQVKPYSDVASKVDGMDYLPGQRSGITNKDGSRIFNTWMPGMTPLGFSPRTPDQPNAGGQVHGRAHPALSGFHGTPHPRRGRPLQADAVVRDTDC